MKISRGNVVVFSVGLILSNLFSLFLFMPILVRRQEKYSYVDILGLVAMYIFVNAAGISVVIKIRDVFKNFSKKNQIK